MGQLLINCDLGEDETDEQTEKLFGLVDAASICCGVHAGSPAKTRRTLAIAAEHEALVGAHPGLRAAGGRGRELPTRRDFRHLLETQVTDFIALAGEAGVEVDYVKLHGSLYHAVERDPDYARTYLEFLASLGHRLGLFALAGGPFVRQAADAGVKIWSEGFVDRAYLKNGTLAHRSVKGAVLTAEDALARLKRWQGSGMMATLDGDPIPLRADTFCVHSDSPDSEMLLQNIKQLVR